MNTISRTALLFSLTCALVGCDASGNTSPAVGLSSPVLERHVIRWSAADLDLVGVAVDPMSGERLVLDRSNRLFTIDPQGVTSLRADLRSSWGETPLHDICAVTTDEVFAVASGFGLKVNLVTHEAQSHFCLEPEPEPGQMNPWDELRHETHAIACDLESSLIFGQPQTLPRDGEDAAPLRSEVSLYDLPSGQDIGWYPLPSELFLAGGMVSVGESIFLGRDSMISSYTLWSGALEPVLDLSPWGVQKIEGMAVDLEAELLLVIDGADSELLILDLQTLGQ